MNSLSKSIGDGVQTFRIRNFEQHFSFLEDLGPDHENYLASRKIIKLVNENIFYALVRVPYKDIEEFVIRITGDIKSINWKEIADRTEQCRWHGPDLEPKFIN